MPVVVDNHQRRVPVSVSRLAATVSRTLRALGRPGAAVDLRVVDDAEVRRLNAVHRGVGRRTDVLAFPLETPAAGGQLLGQIVVSAETAARQARRLGVPVALELDLLATHGTLHLAGWDDRDPVEARLMHERERAILTAARARIPERLWTGLLQPRPPAGVSGGRSSRPHRGRARMTSPRRARALSAQPAKPPSG